MNLPKCRKYRTVDASYARKSIDRKLDDSGWQLEFFCGIRVILPVITLLPGIAPDFQVLHTAFPAPANIMARYLEAGKESIASKAIAWPVVLVRE